MLELYADAPFALVGVNSDADLKEAKQNKAENFGADSGYRSWWDGHAAVNTDYHGGLRGQEVLVQGPLV